MWLQRTRFRCLVIYYYQALIALQRGSRQLNLFIEESKKKMLILWRVWAIL